MGQEAGEEMPGLEVGLTQGSGTGADAPAGTENKVVF